MNGIFKFQIFIISEEFFEKNPMIYGTINIIYDYVNTMIATA